MYQHVVLYSVYDFRVMYWPFNGGSAPNRSYLEPCTFHPFLMLLVMSLLPFVINVHPVDGKIPLLQQILTFCKIHYDML